MNDQTPISLFFFFFFHPFHFYSSEVISGTEEKRPSIIAKDVPIAFIAQEIPRVLGAVSQEAWIRTKCSFLINHNITGIF